MSGYGWAHEDWLGDAAKFRGLRDADFRAPDLIGAVEGWRAWNVAFEPPPFGTAPRLESATYSYWWAPRVKARAECHRCDDMSDGRGVPGEDCSCGFYSAKTLDHLRSMGYHRYSHGSPMVTCVGQLACWGKVIEGSQGWRSEFAYPVRLFVPFEAWRIGKPIAKAYGVPVRLLDLLDPTAYPDQGKDLRA